MVRSTPIDGRERTNSISGSLTMAPRWAHVWFSLIFVGFRWFSLIFNRISLLWPIWPPSMHVCQEMTTFLDDFVHGNRPKIKKNWGITFWSKKSWSLIQVVARKQYISTVAANWIGVFHFWNKFRPIIWGFSSGINLRPAKTSVKKRQNYIRIFILQKR